MHHNIALELYAATLNRNTVSQQPPAISESSSPGRTLRSLEEKQSETRREVNEDVSNSVLHVGAMECRRMHTQRR